MARNMTWLQAALADARAWRALALVELLVLAFMVACKAADAMGGAR